MQKKLSSLFFSTARKMVRLQQAAWRMGMAAPSAGKKAQRRASPAAALIKPKTHRRVATPSPRGELLDTSRFAGTWRGHVYRTPPTPGAWPVRLSYFVYTPPGLRKGSPMLVMLHGCEQTAVEFAWGTRMHRIADRESFLLVYPQQARRAQRHGCWQWYQPDPAHGYAEADAIAGIVGQAAGEHGADPSRVYIAGLSAGASMAALVALRHPDRIAALGMHSGAVLGSARSAAEGLRAMRYGAQQSPEHAMRHLVPDAASFPGMPTIIVQGSGDTVVDARSGAQLMDQWAWVNGLDMADASASHVYASGTAREYMRRDLPAGRSPTVVLCDVPRLGHAWGGGDGRIRFHARQGPDASVLMWRFFKRFERLSAASVTC